MRQILLFLLLPIVAFSQVLFTENFDSYPAGLASTNTTGTSPGSNGYYFYLGTTNAGSSTNLTSSLANFVDFNGSQGLQITSPNGSGGYVVLWKDGLSTAWLARNSANNVAHVKFDFTLTDYSANSKSPFVVPLYSADGKYLVAMYFDLENLFFRPAIYYTDPTNNGNTYFSSIGAIVPSITYQIDMYYDKITGDAQWLINGALVYERSGSITNVDVFELDYITVGTTSNTDDATVIIDNVEITAVSALLGTEDITQNTNVSLLYPNPVKTDFSLKLSDNFDANKTVVTITDMNGKQVFSSNYSESINISHLAKGVYIATISDGVNTENQKLIKE